MPEDEHVIIASPEQARILEALGFDISPVVREEKKPLLYAEVYFTGAVQDYKYLVPEKMKIFAGDYVAVSGGVFRDRVGQVRAFTNDAPPASAAVYFITDAVTPEEW